MKKTILILLFAVSVVGCGDQEEQNKRIDPPSTEVGHKYEIVEIGSCQYVVYHDFGEGTHRSYGGITHKGNCNNPIHEYRRGFAWPESDTLPAGNFGNIQINR